jgi:hypothetical protein
MKRLLQSLWRWLMADAPRDTSGCSRGGMCRHMEGCLRTNCAGHPQANIGRSEEEGTPVHFRNAPGMYLFFAALAIGWIAFVAWLIWK